MPVMLPDAIIRVLRDPAPVARDFTPTRFTPAETKAWFATHFLRFVSSDFPKHQFTKRFYGQVMHTFGMIAHYDRAGFWTEYFTGTAGKVEFLEQVVAWPCYGDAAHTFSDAEREIARRVRHADLLTIYRRKQGGERNAADRADYARLKARFETGPMPVMMTSPMPIMDAAHPNTGRRAVASAPAGQLALAIG